MKFFWFFSTLIFCCLTIKADAVPTEVEIGTAKMNDEYLVVSNNVSHRTSPNGFPINHTNSSGDMTRTTAVRPINDEHLNIEDVEHRTSYHGFPLTSASKGRTRRKRESTPRNEPKIELLIFFDNELGSIIGSTKEEQMEYYLAFMTSVQEIYNNMNKIKVEFYISDIVPLSRRLQDDLFQLRGKNIDSNLTLIKMGEFLYSQDNLPQHDIALFATKGEICSYDGMTGECDEVTAGMAYMGGACQELDHSKQVSSVAILEDSGAFDGVNVAAHEMAHLFNVHHDGSRGVNCPSGAGFVMDAVAVGGRENKNAFYFSSCSENAMLKFFESDSASCLFDDPKGKRPTGVLPGSILSLDDQCEKLMGSSYCDAFPNIDVCMALYCVTQKIGMQISCHAKGPAADGSPCGTGNDRCFSGKCQSEQEIDRLLSERGYGNLSDVSSTTDSELASFSTPFQSEITTEASVLVTKPNGFPRPTTKKSGGGEYTQIPIVIARENDSVSTPKPNADLTSLSGNGIASILSNLASKILRNVLGILNEFKENYNGKNFMNIGVPLLTYPISTDFWSNDPNKNSKNGNIRKVITEFNPGFNFLVNRARLVQNIPLNRNEQFAYSSYPNFADRSRARFQRRDSRFSDRLLNHV